MSKKVTRRQFLKTAGAATAAGAAMTIGAPAIHASQKYLWKMVTTWPPNFPVMGEGAVMVAKWIETMSEGRLKIQVYGAGELVPALEAFNAVSSGTVEMGHGASYYWAGKSQAAQFFAAVPFGLNAQGMNAWLYAGGGQQLWDEVYAAFNLKPFAAGNTGVQMGGWFRKEIKSVADIKGLKMRIPGLGGKVITKLGGSSINVAGGEIYSNLERGVIDATEWVGPYHDYLMGFYKVAKFYYYPGWHEPGTVLESFVNKKAYDALPKDLQEIITTAMYRSNAWMLATFESKNNEYLYKLTHEHKVNLKPFPKDVMESFRKASVEVISEITSKDPISKKVFDHFTAFSKKVDAWAKISEIPYYTSIM
ncbi:TRAP transporter substrate-binding protein [Calditerrivibrio sp.]|uniref:TRAP transporter substrate-binding protein n=1 Tax=Calditerrivibrio sp. TaxID=2792612 RepID=UPI003D0CBE14